jgi:hypothetical protein
MRWTFLSRMTRSGRRKATPTLSASRQAFAWFAARSAEEAPFIPRDQQIKVAVLDQRFGRSGSLSELMSTYG